MSHAEPTEEVSLQAYIPAQSDLYLVYWQHGEGDADGLILHISRIVAWSPVDDGVRERLYPWVVDEEGREGMGVLASYVFDEREHFTVLGIYHRNQIGQDVFDERYREKLGIGMLADRRERMEKILHARVQREAPDHVVRLERDPTKRRPDDSGF